MCVCVCAAEMEIRVSIKVHNVNNCSHTCTLTREAISEFDSLTTYLERVEAYLVESRSETFQRKKKTKKKNRLDAEVFKGTLNFLIGRIGPVTLLT